MISAIWNCETYTGHIRYRKIQRRRDRHRGRVISLLRPAQEQKRGFNEALAIVSAEQFLAVAEATRRRRKHRNA
jgi:hypothetical protein